MCFEVIATGFHISHSSKESRRISFLKLKKKFIHLSVCWVFVAASGPSLVVSMGASPVVEHGFQACRLGSCGTPAWLPGRHVGSSQTRDQTCVPCTGRTLNSRTTREVPRICLELGRSLGIDPTHGLRSFTHPSRHVPVSKCLRFS